MRQIVGKEKGLVFNIQRFSLHDGPGIRTTVFLKGCPLKCVWCANPESQYPLPQLSVQDSHCTACGKCREVCPEKAISFTKNKRRRVVWKKCRLCFQCVNVCAQDALTVIGREETLDDVAGVVEKDRHFYASSGGGVTLSGGEPLMQPEFAISMLARFQDMGLHTVLDTCGHVPPEILHAALSHVDLVLFDIKTLDADLHRKYTGVGNDLIRENAELTAGLVRTWFRIPLIAGFNDSIDEIRRVAKMACSL
ncbi:MAG: glycyl-radical enzyme activating protein, partial [Deltaproteobacteria bacterium HGW-Deltaproteobacteria-9]